MSADERFQIAIIGAGPAGLAAAANAAASGVAHVLLEAAPRIADTLRRYLRARRIMAEPAELPLRSGLSFTAGPSEGLLQTWEEEIRRCGVHLRTGSCVSGITGSQGAFRLSLTSGDIVTSASVVLAIGMQGNIRRLGVSGETLPQVQCQLDDPEEYRNQTIVVVGAGDAAIETALALIGSNEVILINRREAVLKCTEENYNALASALEKGLIECRNDTTIDHIVASEEAGPALTVVANSRQGLERISCDRVIARLGADPPRLLLESFGIEFSNPDRDALPRLSAHGESNLPGLFVVGALGGNPLIKQALNQGHDVIDHILGRPVVAADEPMLATKLAAWRPDQSVGSCLADLQNRLPLFADIPASQFRALVLASSVVTAHAGDVIFRRNDYSTSFYSVVAGEVGVAIQNGTEDNKIAIRAGSFFGEMALISGRRRSATIVAQADCTLIETPRRTILKLLAIESVRRRIDQVAIERTIHSYLGVFLTQDELERLARSARIRRYEAGEVLFHQGDQADGLHLIRRGSVTVSRLIGGREVVLFYAAAGSYVGEMALVSGRPRYATVRAVVGGTETIVLDAEQVTWLTDRHPSIRRRMDERYFDYVRTGEEERRLAREPNLSKRGPESLVTFLQRGIGGATDLLLIDLSLCVRCGNCEVACAASHQGTSRLARMAGPTLGSIHLPASCRHCEHPHCMKDCPPDALRRAVGGEVFIDDSCIGCGNCKTNCPYGVIQLAPATPDCLPRSLWQVLLGRKASARIMVDGNTELQAVKCDMCRDLQTGPACVRACPTGAALRVGPEEFLDYTRHRVGEVW